MSEDVPYGLHCDCVAEIQNYEPGEAVHVHGMVGAISHRAVIGGVPPAGWSS
jgi:hypothetical protein